LLGLSTAGGPLSEDLADIPLGAKYLALRGKSRGLARLRQLTSVEVLWASGITPKLLDELPSLPRLRALNLYQVGRTDLSAVGRLASVEHLLIGWANYLVDITWLAQLPRLRTLVIEDAQRLNLETLPQLPALQALQLGGGIWKVLKLPSLNPLRRVPALKYLSLTSVTVQDGSLHPLGDLAKLRSLHTANIFSVEESAWLAAQHPDIESPVLRPIFAETGNDAQGQPVFPCLICGGNKVMPTMRRAPLWCPRCDVARIRKHVAKWETARSSVTRRVP
jgi:hypothetical protein